MISCSFEKSNHVLDKPKDMSYEECDCLSVLVTKTESGIPIVISCWKLTQEELQEINKTGRIWLTICGNTMPPVALNGIRPF